MEIKHFTHSDLDGVVATVLLTKYYSKKNGIVSSELSAAGEIDEKISGYLDSVEYNSSAIIYITDLTCSLETAERLANLPNRVVLIDHHKTAVDNFGGKYDWMYIKEGDAATLLTYEYLLKAGAQDRSIVNEITKYKELAYLTDLIDTKSRKSPEYLKNYDKITKLNLLFSSMKINEFKRKFISNPSVTFSPVEKAMIDTASASLDHICKGTNIYIYAKEIENQTIKYGLAFSLFYKSDVAEYLLYLHSDVKFLFLVDMNKANVSLRRNEGVENIDLSEIAKEFHPEGGGHPFAAGFSFDFKDYHLVIDKIMNGDFHIA